MPGVRWVGVCFSLCAAIGNTGSDTLRKHASKSIPVLPTTALVACVAVFDAIISVTGVAATSGFADVLKIQNPLLFCCLLCCSSGLLIGSKIMYQRALLVSPLSLTIPYLSATPAFLLLTAYLFVGESPSLQGIFGVCIVAASGFLLNVNSAPGKVKQDREPSNPGAVSALRTSIDPLYVSCYLGASSVEDGVKYEHPIRRPAGVLGLLAALRREPGPSLMLAVAAIWSFTASLDKLAVIHAPSLVIYFVLQRLLIGAIALSYLVLFSRDCFSYFVSDFYVLLGISIMDLFSVISFLKALNYVYVSYVVSIKRCNIVFSVLLGGLLFQENIHSRMPYIMVMMFGMLVIVFQPH